MTWFLRALEEMKVDIVYQKGDDIEFFYKGDEYRATILKDRICIHVKDNLLSITEDNDLSELLEVQ